MCANATTSSQRIEADSTGVCSISTGANRYFISVHSVIYACVCEPERNVLIKAHEELKRIPGPNQSKLCIPLIRSRNFSDLFVREYGKLPYIKTNIKFAFVKIRPLMPTITKRAPYTIQYIIHNPYNFHFVLHRFQSRDNTKNMLR